MAIQWPNEKGQNSNDTQYNGQMKRDKIQWPNEKGQMGKL